jgi:hypothetical protein
MGDAFLLLYWVWFIRVPRFYSYAECRYADSHSATLRRYFGQYGAASSHFLQLGMALTQKNGCYSIAVVVTSQH